MRRLRISLILFVVLSTATLHGAGEFSNRRAPGFALPGSDGKEHDPQDYRGTVLLIETMQTTCPHCARFSGILDEAASKYGNRIAILSIVTMPDTADKVRQYIQTNKVTNPILFDCGQVMASYLKITPAKPTVQFPHVFLVDRDGMIRNDFGFGPGTEEIFEGKGLFPEIEKLLKK